jgi:hypothetical protein
MRRRIEDGEAKRVVTPFVRAVAVVLDCGKNYRYKKL